MQHKIKVNVANREAQPVVKSWFKRFPRWLFYMLFGKCDVMCMSVGKSVKSVEIHEQGGENDGNKTVDDSRATC